MDCTGSGLCCIYRRSYWLVTYLLVEVLFEQDLPLKNCRSVFCGKDYKICWESIWSDTATENASRSPGWISPLNLDEWTWTNDNRIRKSSCADPQEDSSRELLPRVTEGSNVTGSAAILQHHSNKFSHWLEEANALIVPEFEEMEAQRADNPFDPHICVCCEQHFATLEELQEHTLVCEECAPYK